MITFFSAHAVVKADLSGSQETMYGQEDLSSTSIKTSRNFEGNVKKTKTLGKQNVKISS